MSKLLGVYTGKIYALYEKASHVGECLMIIRDDDAKDPSFLEAQKTRNERMCLVCQGCAAAAEYDEAIIVN